MMSSIESVSGRDVIALMASCLLVCIVYISPFADKLVLKQVPDNNQAEKWNGAGKGGAPHERIPVMDLHLDNSHVSSTILEWITNGNVGRLKLWLLNTSEQLTL